MAIRFDASTDRISRNSDLPASSRGFTWVCWYKTVVDRNDWSQGIGNLSASTSNYIYIETDATGTQYQVWFSGGSNHHSLNLLNITVNQWVYFAYTTSSSGSVNGYYGALGAPLTKIGPHATAINSFAPNLLQCGDTVWTNEWCNGAMCYAGAWTSELSQAEIEAQRFATRPVRTADLYEFWPMYSGSSERLRGSVHGRNWTAGGALTDEEGSPFSYRIPARWWFVVGSGGGTTHHLSATLAGSTATSDDTNLAVKRNVQAAAQAGSSTPGANLAVTRRLAATTAGASQTPDIDLAVLRRLSATASGATATTEAGLTVARHLLATLAGSSATSTPELAVLRKVSATASGQTATADAAVAVARKLSVTLSGQSATAGIEVAVLRSVAATLSGGTLTPDDVALDLSTVYRLVASLSGGSQTSAPELAVLRKLAAAASGQSKTGAVELAVLRSVAATLSGGTLTPDDVALDLSTVYRLVASLSGGSQTSAPELAVLRRLAAVAAGQSETATAELRVLRRLAASLSAGTLTPDDVALLVHTATLLRLSFALRAPEIQVTLRAPEIQAKLRNQ